jgi:hypothetical protein
MLLDGGPDPGTERIRKDDHRERLDPNDVVNGQQPVPVSHFSILDFQ